MTDIYTSELDLESTDGLPIQEEELYSEDLDEKRISAVLARKIRRKSLLANEAPEFTQRLNTYTETQFGQTIILIGRFRAWPRPQVTWFKDDAAVVRTLSHSWDTIYEGAVGETSLTLMEVTSNDEGTYRCKVVNDEGSAATTGYLSVMGKPVRTTSHRARSRSHSPRVNSSRKNSERSCTPSGLKTIQEQKSIEEEEEEECLQQGPSPIQEFIDDVTQKRRGLTKNAGPLVFCLENIYSGVPTQEDSTNFDQTEHKEQTLVEDQSVKPTYATFKSEFSNKHSSDNDPLSSSLIKDPKDVDFKHNSLTTNVDTNTGKNIATIPGLNCEISRSPDVHIQSTDGDDSDYDSDSCSPRASDNINTDLSPIQPFTNNKSVKKCTEEHNFSAQETKIEEPETAYLPNDSSLSTANGNAFQSQGQGQGQNRAKYRGSMAMRERGGASLQERRAKPPPYESLNVDYSVFKDSEITNVPIPTVGRLTVKIATSARSSSGDYSSESSGINVDETDSELFPIVALEKEQQSTECLQVTQHEFSSTISENNTNNEAKQIENSVDNTSTVAREHKSDRLKFIACSRKIASPPMNCINIRPISIKIIASSFNKQVSNEEALINECNEVISSSSSEKQALTEVKSDMLNENEVKTDSKPDDCPSSASDSHVFTNEHGELESYNSEEFNRKTEQDEILPNNAISCKSEQPSPSFAPKNYASNNISSPGFDTKVFDTDNISLTSSPGFDTKISGSDNASSPGFDAKASDTDNTTHTSSPGFDTKVSDSDNTSSPGFDTQVSENTSHTSSPGRQKRKNLSFFVQDVSLKHPSMSSVTTDFDQLDEIEDLSKLEQQLNSNSDSLDRLNSPIKANSDTHNESPHNIYDSLGNTSRICSESHLSGNGNFNIGNLKGVTKVNDISDNSSINSSKTESNLDEKLSSNTNTSQKTSSDESDQNLHLHKDTIGVLMGVIAQARVQFYILFISLFTALTAAAVAGSGASTVAVMCSPVMIILGGVTVVAFTETFRYLWSLFMMRFQNQNINLLPT